MLQNIKSDISAIFMVVLFIAAMTMAIQSLRQDTIGTTSSNTTLNYAITLTNNTYLSNENWVSSIDSVVANKSGAYELITTANYTVNNLYTNDPPTITLKTSAFNNNATKVNLTRKNDLENGAVNITNYGLAGHVATGEQLPTIGILLGISALIVVVVAGFYMIKR